MLITSATPQELINWFHDRQEEQRVLCVMLAPAQEDQQKLSLLIGDLFNADAALGQEIAFLLLHPNANTPLGIDKGYGRFATFRGSAFPSHHNNDLAYSLRDVEIFRDMSSEGEHYRQEIAYESAKSTALFAPDFMKLFNISPNELPAMCTIVKGLDASIVLPLGKDWTPDSLLTLLRSIRSLADNLPNFRAEYQTLSDKLPAKLPALSESMREINAKVAHITEVLERLVHRYEGTENDRTVIADFIARSCPSSAQLEYILENISFSSNDRYLRDNQVKRVISLMMKVEFVRDEIAKDLRSRTYVLSIADRAKHLVERREKLFQDINNIREARVKINSHGTSRSLSRVKSCLDGINLTGDLTEKLLIGIDWVRKLVSV